MRTIALAFAFLAVAACGDDSGNNDMGVALNGVVVNEVFAQGPSGAMPDWAELKNVSDKEADLSGWKVRDKDPADLFVLPPGTTIAAKGYLLIYCDDQVDGGVSGGIHVPWKLSANNGDEFHLVSPGGIDVDATTFPAGIAVDSSWGRLPDGTGNFTTMTPTPGKANY